ncbi:MAG: 23S rRNA (adenine(2503)-C(2))-methyltransferase RlmN [bacterium]
MNLDNLEKIFSGKPTFQLRQAKEAVFKHLIDDWTQATSLPRDLRETLNKECPLDINAQLFTSDDKNTIKALIALEDGLKIETVLMRYQNGRNTICVSSQVGCPLNCLFCATGKTGFKRDLTVEEIIEQVLLFARLLKKDSQRVDNVVFMGMGEPFLNYDNVMAAIKILNDQKQGMSIGARHISVSTVGVPGGIKKFADEPLQINLAISLHAPNNELRIKIVPANKKYPIEKILKDVADYLKKTGRKIMFEYIMIKGLNDSPTDAEELARLLNGSLPKPFMVNLISYNPTGIFESSTQENIKRFKDALTKQHIEVTQRYKFGSQIRAACGQLAVK